MPSVAESQYPLTSPSGGYFGAQKPIEQSRQSTLPERPLKWTHKISHWASTWWIWETSACFVAMTVHIAMIALLNIYKDARVSSWTNRWTLNSNIALMITVIKGAALIPVASALGQLKWRRFRNYREIQDMDVFDEASRGTLGSLRLLLHLRFWHFASLGALLTVSALFMDTLAQNVLSTYSKLEITDGIATIPRINNYGTFNEYTTGDVPGDQLPWPSMVAAINYGLSYTSSLFWAGSELPVHCLTGNCTFGTYQSLIVERQCMDVTGYLDSSDDSVVKIPRGPHLRRLDGIINSSATTEYPAMDIFKDVGPLITNFQVITNPDLELWAPVAMQCVLYWAVNTFGNSSMTNFTLYEPITGRWTNLSTEARTTYKQPDYIILQPPDCWINGTQITNSTDERCQNWVGNLAQLGLQNFLSSDRYGLTGEVYKTSNGWFTSNLFVNSLSNVVADALTNETYNVMELTINNTAIMITQGVRQLPTNSTDYWAYEPANGTVYQWETFYGIHFKFLALTHFIVAGSVMFLLLTVFLCRTDHPWKTSTLPFLFHGFTTRDRNAFGEMPRYVDMREASESMKVKLAMTAEGQRLVSRETFATG